MVGRLRYLLGLVTTLLFIAIVSVLQTGIASAVAGVPLPPTQSELFQEHIGYFNIDDCSSGNSAPAAAPSATPSASDIYMIGDSVMVGAYFDNGGPLKKAISDAGLTAQVDASGGRGMSYAGSDPRGNLPGKSKSGLDAIKADSNAIKSSDTVVIELGTNETDPPAGAAKSTALFKGEMEQAINEVKNINSSATIYWVNLFSNASQPYTPWIKEYNLAISQVASEKGTNVIDTTGAGISLADGTHPDPAGYKTLSKTIVSALAPDNAATPQPTNAAAGCCPGAGAAAAGDAGLTGSDNEEKSWNYFIGKGMTPIEVAGIMGNISQESGFDPQNIEDPAGRTKDPFSVSTGWGLIQFTPYPPYATAGDIIKSVWAPDAHVVVNKDNIYLLSTQLDIVYGYMDHQNMLGQYKSASTDPHAAALSFEQLVEHAGTPDMTNRYAAADDAMKKYGQGAAAGTPASPASPGAGAASCSCPTAAAAADTGTIVLDPGHSTFSDDSSQNALTGLYDTDTTGGPNEMHDAWVAANKIKPLLEKKGYTVKLTKNSENESINLSQRAERANKDNAALLFTMHADSNVRWLAYPDKNSTRVPDGSKRKDGTNGLVHPDIEDPSKSFAEKMAPIIAKGISKSGDAYDAVSFNDYYGSDGLSGNGLNTGNTPVQTILSSVPEVYSEVSPTDLPSDAFAQAATDAISAVVSPSGNAAAAPAAGGAAAAAGGCSGAVSGDLQSTVKNYAWPDYKGSGFTQPEPAYKAAIQTAQGQGEYVGGNALPGIDCGGFVSLAMINSGYEPGYNYSDKLAKGAGPTSSQEAWLKANWQQIHPKSTADMQPGDVAINADHTYMYVGKIPGFNSVVASASLDSRAPMAGEETPADPAFDWFRIK